MEPDDAPELRDDITRLAEAVGRGEPAAADRLLPLVYDDLRRLAAARLARESVGVSLEATGLVHEAYLRLLGGDPDRAWDGRRHFFGAAAEAMRRILVERARHRNRLKRGGGLRRHDVHEVEPPAGADAGSDPNDELLALDEALGRLAAEDPAVAELVRLRYFAGLTTEQAAELLGISRATAERRWTYARAYLRREVRGPGPPV